ncbi:MAG: hypothetical protein CM15mP127_15760 [Gammaproteobacteria bacterium]|nr:MAG: hypothetical protein CM15mP127_15760 [Gammaproteobacteria bacterium]
MLLIGQNLEFSQVDIEASFVEEQDVMKFSEEMIKNVFKKTVNYDLKRTSLKITWSDAESYGSDKPDLRNPLKLALRLSSFFKRKNLRFSQILQILMKAELLLCYS